MTEMNKPVRPHSNNGIGPLHMAEAVEKKVECAKCGEDGSETTLKEKTPTAPIKQNKAEVRSHCLTHQPYRSWCRWCVLGRAQERSTREFSVVSMDYMHLTGNNEGTNTVLVGHDDHTNRVGARVAPAKGRMISVSQRLVQWANEMEHGKIILKCDQEPAILELQAGVRTERAKAPEETSKHFKSLRSLDDEIEGLEIIPEHSPVGESQRNGAVENAMKRLHRHIRTIKLPLEHSLGEKFDVGPDLWHWLVECAANMFNRFRIGADGVTLYKMIKGRKTNNPATTFG